MVSGGQTSSNQQSQQNGFSALPQGIQTAFTNLGQNVNSTLLNGNGNQMFTPIGQTADETAGYKALESANPLDNLQSNIDAQMNPYMSSVIDQVNRQAQGQYSLTNQASAQAGQMGSNRSILGANDIDQTRLQTIGGLLGNQYNTALQNALTTIPQGLQSYGSSLISAGQNQRQLATDTQQAPVNALLAAAQALGVLPKTDASGTSSGSSSGWNAGAGTK